MIGNTIVNDGHYKTTPYGPDYAVGIAVWDPEGDGVATGSSVVEGNQVSYSGPEPGRADMWIQEAVNATEDGNTALTQNPTNDLELKVLWEWVHKRWAANDRSGPHWGP